MEQKNPLMLFMEESPEVQQAYAGFIQSLVDMKSLDARTKQLIYIGMKMVADDERAIRMHVPMAKNAGATREEIKSAVVLGLSVIGMKAVSKFLPIVLEEFDKAT